MGESSTINTANEAGRDTTDSDTNDPDANDPNANDPDGAADIDSDILDPAPVDPLVLGRRADRRKARRRYRWRSRIAVGLAFLVILLVGGGIYGLGYWKAHDKPLYDVPQHVAKHQRGVIIGGSGPVRVDVYIDYACPQCKKMAASTSGMFSQLVAANAITLVYHPLAVLDSASPTQFSTRAGNSATCAASLGAFPAYSNLLFARQPKANSAGLSDDELVQIAGQAGLINPDFAKCVRDGTYDKWIAVQNATAAKARIAAPAVLVNGKLVGIPGATPSVAQLSAAIG
jgi:protein-disulfide isomerase